MGACEEDFGVLPNLHSREARRDLLALALVVLPIGSHKTKTNLSH
jgi:hypothetical protein